MSLLRRSVKKNCQHIWQSFPAAVATHLGWAVPPKDRVPPRGLTRLLRRNTHRAVFLARWEHAKSGDINSVPALTPLAQFPVPMLTASTLPPQLWVWTCTVLYVHGCGCSKKGKIFGECVVVVVVVKTVCQQV